MDIKNLPPEITLYKIAQVLNITKSAPYKWKKNGKIPALRLYELKEKKPHWFDKNAKVVNE